MAGLVRSFVLQLAGYAAARRTRILIHGPTPPLLAARFLPAVILSAQEAYTLETLAAGPGRDYERGVLIIVAALRTAVLRAVAVSLGWQVIDCAGGPAPAAGAALVLTERTAWLSSAGSSLEFTPDLVPSRRLRPQLPPAGGAGPGVCVPGRASPVPVPLAGCFRSRRQDISSRWAGSTAAPGLPVLVGVGSSGPAAAGSPGRRSPLPGRGHHRLRQIGVPPDPGGGAGGRASPRPRQSAVHRFQGRIRSAAAGRPGPLRRAPHGSRP